MLELDTPRFQKLLKQYPVIRSAILSLSSCIHEFIQNQYGINQLHNSGSTVCLKSYETSSLDVLRRISQFL